MFNFFGREKASIFQHFSDSISAYSKIVGLCQTFSELLSAVRTYKQMSINAYSTKLPSLLDFFSNVST